MVVRHQCKWCSSLDTSLFTHSVGMGCSDIINTGLFSAPITISQLRINGRIYQCNKCGKLFKEGEFDR